MTNKEDKGAVAELIRTLNWYDVHASRTRIAYQALRVLTIVLAAAIPVVAVADGSSIITAALGSAIVVTEGLQQLFQFHNRWVDYRSAWNALERERRLYQSAAGPYAQRDDPDRLLAERIEVIIESENVNWGIDTTAVDVPTTESDAG